MSGLYETSFRAGRRCAAAQTPREEVAEPLLARQIGAGALSFGALVAFIQYTNRFFLPIRDLGAKYTVMQSAMASAERIFGLLDRAPAIVSPATPTADRARADRATDVPALEFSSVWFAYDADRYVLRDCSFRVAAGEHVALVGATGPLVGSACSPASAFVAGSGRYLAIVSGTAAAPGAPVQVQLLEASRPGG